MVVSVSVCVSAGCWCIGGSLRMPRGVRPTWEFLSAPRTVRRLSDEASLRHTCTHICRWRFLFFIPRALPFRACFNALFNLLHYTRLEMRNNAVKRRSICLFAITVRARCMYTWTKVKCLVSYTAVFLLLVPFQRIPPGHDANFFVPWEFWWVFLLFLFVFPRIASDMQSGSFQKEPVSVCETAVILDS